MFRNGKIAKAAAIATTAVGILMPSGEAQAQTAVPFNGVVAASCVLSVNTPGVLGVSANSGTELGSEQPGGVAAVLGVVATAGTPTVLFTAPSVSAKPVAYSRTPVVSVKYTSPGGANQAYTSGASQYTSSNPLGDTITLNAKAVDAAGFPAGTYQLQTTATCQQN